MSKQFDNVSVLTKGNVYFGGKCISHTILMSDGSKKTLGIILPSTLNFTTGAPEVMDITAGKCRIRLQGQENWQEYSEGTSFSVPGNSSFDIEVIDTVDYVCHYG